MPFLKEKVDFTICLDSQIEKGDMLQARKKLQQELIAIVKNAKAFWAC